MCCLFTLLQNERKSDVARFTTHEKKNPFKLTCSKTGSNVGGKTRNIAKFNSFCTNVAKQVARFYCPFYCSFNCSLTMLIKK